MAPMTNFSVPTRSLTSAKERTLTPGTISTPANDFVFFEPVFSRSSKAERILGPAEIFTDQSHEKKSSGSPFSRLRLRKFTSKTAGSPGLNGDRAANNTKERYERPTQASSSLLGCPHSISNNMASTMGSGFPWYDSSSAPSHYDPLSSPLCISQQKSAASSCDIALPKGMSPNLQNPAKALSVSPTGTIDSGLREHSEEAKRRPPRLNLSNSFPNTRTSNRPSISPHQTKSSPSVVSVVSDNQQSPLSSRRGWLKWRSDKSKGSPSYPGETLASSSRAKEYNPFFVEACAGKSGVDMDIWSAAGKTWKTQKLEAMGNLVDSRAVGQVSSCSSLDSPSRKSSGSVVTLTSEISARDTMHESQSLQSSSSRKSSISFGRQNHGKISSTNKPHQKHYTDLCIQSVLSLSSSEDESDGVSEIPKRAFHRSYDAESPKNLLDIVGYSQPTKLTPPRHRAKAERGLDDKSPVLPYRTRMRDSEATGALGEPPERSSYLRTESNQAQQSEVRDSNALGAGITAPMSTNYMSNTSPNVHTKDILPKNRVMVVTKEEERLLEAMREKKANMRQAIKSAEGFNAAAQQEIHPLLRRPKTADAGRRSSALFNAEIASFPAPPSSKSMRTSRLSYGTVSSEDISQLREFDNSDETPLPALRNSFLGPSIASSQLSYNPSDLLPSPATSQGSPLTPPPDQLSTRFSHDPYKPLPKQSPYRDLRDHHKRRTISSDMIVLVGLQKEMREEVLGYWADSGCEPY